MKIHLARQPVFNRNKKIHGYELLFRDGALNAFPGIDGDTATSQLLSSSFFNAGIDDVSRGKKAFINFTRKLLVEKIPTMFPRERIVVEVLEDVEVADEVVCACREMADAGYEIALDDFVYSPHWKPLLPLSKIIKIDFRLSSMDEVEDHVARLADYPVKLLAEKVETHEEFKKALDLGFHYFQGYFFCRPEIFSGRDISPTKINILQIMAELNREDFDFTDLEKLVARDVSLAYKLLHYMNSPYFRRVTEISNVKQAIVLLGEMGMRRFISLIVMTKLASEKPDELVRTSIARARLCELLGRESPLAVDSAELFTLGLFSLIDAILDDTMERLMEKLPLTENIKKALVEGEGRLKDFIELTVFYEMGDWDNVSAIAGTIGVTEEKLPGFYVDALSWGDSLAKI